MQNDNLTTYGRTLTLQLITAGVSWNPQTQMLVFGGAPISGIDVNRKFENVDQAAGYIHEVLHGRFAAQTKVA